MMLTLVIYILKRLVNHGTADGECGITALPFKLLIIRCDGFYPSATVAFHLFHDMGYAHVLGEQEEDVDMIANSAHLYHVASRGIDQLTNIRMYAFDFPITDLGTRCFDVEYQMYVYFAQ